MAVMLITSDDKTQTFSTVDLAEIHTIAERSGVSASVADAKEEFERVLRHRDVVARGISSDAMRREFESQLAD